MIIYYFLIGVMPLERHPIWTSFFGGLTVIKYIGGAAALYALLYSFIKTSRVRYFRSWAARAYCFYALAAMTSYVFTGDMANWQYSVFSICLSNLLMFFVTLTVVDSIQRLRRVLLVFIGAVAFASLYAIRDWQKYHGIYAGYRPSGAAGDPNYFCLTAIFCIPLALYLAFERKKRFQFLFCIGSLIVTVIAVTLGASRGGILGLAAVAIMIAVQSRRHRWKYVAFFVLVIVGPALLVPNSPIRRLVLPSSGDVRNADSRTAAWRAGLRMIAGAPLDGVGVGRFKWVVGRYAGDEGDLDSVAHNTYIEIAAELGLPVFAAWCAMIVSTFGILSAARRRAARARAPLIACAANGIRAGLAGALFAIFFISAEFEKDLWLFVFLSMTVYSLSLRCRRASRPVNQAVSVLPPVSGRGLMAALRGSSVTGEVQA